MKNLLADDARAFYKPFTTRSPVLFLLLIFTLLLIALLELACRSIPNHVGIGRVESFWNETNRGNPKRGIEKRQTLLLNPSLIPVLATSRIPESVVSNTRGSLLLNPTLMLPVGPTSTVSETAITSTIQGVQSSNAPVRSNLPSLIFNPSLVLITSSSPLPIITQPATFIHLIPTFIIINGVTSSFTTTVTGGGGLVLGDGSTPTPSDVQVVSPTPTSVSPATTPSPVAGPVISQAGGPTLTDNGAPSLGFLSLGSDGKPDAPSTIAGAVKSDEKVATSSPIDTPTPIIVVADGQTSTIIPPIAAVATTPTPIDPPPVVALIDGKTSTLQVGQSAIDSNGAPLPILTSVNGQAVTITPVLLVTVVDGRTFSQVATPQVTMAGGSLSTFTPTPVISVVDGTAFTLTPSPFVTMVGNSLVTFTPTPIISAVDGTIFTLIPSPVVTMIGGSLVTFTPTPIITQVAGKLVVQTPVLTMKDGVLATITPAPESARLTVVDGRTYTALASPIVTVISGKTYTEVAAGVPLTSSTIRSSTVLHSIQSTHNVIHPTATLVNSTGTFLAWSNGATTIFPRISLRQYLSVSFIPLILAVLFTVPLRILDSTLRELEPFYQLSSASGALGSSSLLLSYPTTILFALPIQSIRKGHFLIFWSSLITITSLTLAPLSSEALFVSSTGYCPPNTNYVCYGVWAIYPALARLMQGMLSFIGVLLTLILVVSFCRKSGVYSEPLSVVGLAALLYKSPALQEFKQFDSQVKMKELRKSLGTRRYALRHFIADNQEHCYGIVSLEPDTEAGLLSKTHSTAKTDQKGPYSLLNTSERDLPAAIVEEAAPSRTKHVWWNIKEKLFYISAFLFLTGVLCLICYYFWTGFDTSFERFMDSQGFGVRFMMTILGVAVKLLWGNIDQDLRKMSPYHSLLLHPTSAQDSILVPIYQSPLSAILPSLKRKHYLVSLTCFLSLLSEFLPICLANVTYSSVSTKAALRVCNIVSIVILMLMVLTMGFLVCRGRRNVRPLPRRLESIAATGVYLASKEDKGRQCLMDGMKGLSVLGRRDRDIRVEKKGGLYAMGIVEGDGLRIEDERLVGRWWSG